MYSLYRAWLSLNHHCSQLPPTAPLHPLNPLIIPDPATASTTNTTSNNNISTNVSPLNLTNHHNQHHQGGTNLAPELPMGMDQTSLAATRDSTNGNSSGTHQNQPDVCLQVGTTMTSFSAHRNVLTAHSGYFKAALANHTGPGPIHVLNVNVDEFSSLLTFMYTGYLDLNISNIYNILLATHILHMPRALEICRTYLINQQPISNQQVDHGTKTHQQLPGNIIKPIASRRQLVVGQINQQVFAPIYSNLEKSESTPFKVVEKSGVKMHMEQMASTSKLMETPIEKRSVVNSSKKTGSTSGNSKVVIDIACCDGPVRFHRVVNKNYGQTDVVPNVESAPINKNAALNKVMQENINKQRTTTDENAKATDLFTCLYCNHTFKSQYCYQKHARRHLNPVNVDNTLTTATTSIQKVENTRREVRLLDMNVQYYPCKTCGSKFPSYYFVHKHRKMCHAEEMADNENKNNEIVAHNSDGRKDGHALIVADDEDENTSSSGSKNSVIIDVEDVETDSNV